MTMNGGTRRHQSLVGLATVLLAAACSGDPAGPGTPVPPPPPQAHLALSHARDAGNRQDGMPGRALSAPLRVVVTRNGAPVSGVAIVWSTQYGEITADGPTDASGEATATWRLGRGGAGTQRARAALADRASPPVDFVATVIEPVFTVIGHNQHEVQVGSVVPVPLRARLTWQGRAMAGEPIEWLGGTVTPSADETDAAGEITATWQLGEAAGLQSVVARPRAWAPDGPQASFYAIALPGPAVKLQWTHAWQNVAAFLQWRRGNAAPLPVSATLLDAFGNGVPHVPVTLTLRAERGTTVRTLAGTTDISGVLQRSFTLSGADAADDFSVGASTPSLPDLGIDYRIFDFRLNDWHGFGYYWDQVRTTVRAGTTVRLGGPTWYACPFRLEEVLPSGEIRHLGMAGSLASSANGVLERRFDTPGGYRFVCDNQDATSDILTVEVTP